MPYKCIKAVEQKAYCLFIYLIGSNYASMYSEERQPKPIVIFSDSCGHKPGADDPLAKAANESDYKVYYYIVCVCVDWCSCG